MKKSLIIILVFLITLMSSIMIKSVFEEGITANNQKSCGKVNLVIDAGHGGIDAGTIGVDGANEKDINLAIALKLYDFVKVSGASAALIRDGDYLFYKENDNTKRSDLYNRLDFVNSIDNSVLISIHQNHFEDEKEWGMQIWYSPNNIESKALADNILKISNNNLQKKNTRQNKESDDSYYILYKATSPSVMVECGFMSNNNENKKLQNNTYQNELAYSIMLGFSDYAFKEK